jgi:hypothetical protein
MSEENVNAYIEQVNDARLTFDEMTKQKCTPPAFAQAYPQAIDKLLYALRKLKEQINGEFVAPMMPQESTVTTAAPVEAAPAAPVLQHIPMVTPGVQELPSEPAAVAASTVDGHSKSEKKHKKGSSKSSQ